MDSRLSQLAQQLDQVQSADRHRLRRRLGKLRERAAQNQAVDKGLAELEAKVAASCAVVEAKRAAVPPIDLPGQLPVAQKADVIAEAIRDHQVVVIAGETGSGKTTQIPKICLQLGRGINGLIGHTQPRRIAARTVAQRIADELKVPLGEAVGYQVRFTDVTRPTSFIKLMTDGILLSEIQRDRFLNRYDTLIIDEAHERSLNIDFLLGYLKQLLPRRPDLKLIITSATIDVDSFSRHFDNAPVIEVSGRTYPVSVQYHPLAELSADNTLSDGVVEALHRIESQEQGGQRGDVLVFLPGEREIRETARALRKAELRHADVLPLYARLSVAEQNRVFDTGQRRGRRVVLATNVAETSLTVPGIRYVIDSGYARISRYSYRSKIQRLPIEPVSQASANQRKGRCGRVAEGVCLRLYDEDDFNNRPEYTDPEIKRTNLASVILQMLAGRLGDIETFPFVDAPDRRLISDGYKLLEELGAVDRRHRLTEAGRALARFPVDPRISRMLLAASERGCLREVLIIASALSVQDPRERPAEKTQAADEKHQRFQDEQSDFLSFVNLWDYLEQQRQDLSQNQLRKQCGREFLSYLRYREWRDVHHQLRLQCRDAGWKENTEPANYESVHRALLAGLLSHIAQLDEKHEYRAARNRRLKIFPGSGLFKRGPKWLMAAEIVETTQVYARCNARIEPEWVLGLNDHLLKRSHAEPHWDARGGRVMAFETVSLYGLVISERRKVHYAPIDPVSAREIFIRAALVEGRLKKRPPFLRHNLELIEQIHELEAKARRRDILADEQALFDFYAERLPESITTLRRFEQWRKEAERQHPKLLFIDRDRLMRRGAEEISEAQFPGELSHGDLRIQLLYHFEPGHEEDGVTAVLPIGVLNRAPVHLFEWLVPGLLRDKCIALVKSLPKSIRKKLVPVPDYVDRALAELRPDDTPLLPALARQLEKLASVNIEPGDWQLEQLDGFYQMHYRVLDRDGRLLGKGSDLPDLQRRFSDQIVDSLQAQTDERFHTQSVTRWDFGDLPETHSFEQAGVTVKSYPGLVDHGDTVAIELLPSAEQARYESEQGLVRLLMLQLPQQVKYVRKQLLKGNDLLLQFVGIKEDREAWVEDLLYAVFHRLFVADRELPRDETAFRRRLEEGKGQLVAEAQAYTALLAAIAAEYNRARQLLNAANDRAWRHAVEDIREQLQGLFAPGFIARTPWRWLQQYPRYLKAVQQRLEKLRGHYQRDKQVSVGLHQCQQRLRDLLNDDPQAISRSEALRQYRWLLEEYRVSLFAQQLGTIKPVSEKRLNDQWERVKASLA